VEKQANNFSLIIFVISLFSVYLFRSF